MLCGLGPDQGARRMVPALVVPSAVRRDGHQKDVIDLMQTRAELYDRIGYHAFENKLDALFAAKKK